MRDLLLSAKHLSVGANRWKRKAPDVMPGLKAGLWTGGSSRISLWTVPTVPPSARHASTKPQQTAYWESKRRDPGSGCGSHMGRHVSLPSGTSPFEFRSGTATSWCTQPILVFSKKFRKRLRQSVGKDTRVYGFLEPIALDWSFQAFDLIAKALVAFVMLPLGFCWEGFVD